MGSNMLIVRSGSSRAGGVRGGAGSQPTITWEDLGKIESDVPSVRSAAPAPQHQAQAMAEGANWSTSVQGTTPDYFEIRDWEVGQGRALTDADVDDWRQGRGDRTDGRGPALRALSRTRSARSSASTASRSR